MEFLDLKDISERGMYLLNPSSPEKVITAGRMAGMHPGAKTIDFGAGFAEPLVLWSEYFDVHGVGIDLRPYACQRARDRIAEKGFEDRQKIVCQNAREYRFEPHAYDVAVCLGATFIWDGLEGTLAALKQAIKPSGKLIVGEVYWRKGPVPPEFLAHEAGVHTEFELLQIAREAGFDIAWVERASHADWDHYESGNWQGLLRWIEESPNHPERQQVIDHLHESQEEYFRYGREYFGWAIYVLNPRQYGPSG